MSLLDLDQSLHAPIAIIGTGVAGLINAHVLLGDGFTDITLITRDSSVGGVWARERVYPGLHINNVHGEYKFSSLEMPPPERAESTGGRLTGTAMRDYMETFYKTYLEGKAKFLFNTEVLNIRRDPSPPDANAPSWPWKVQVAYVGTQGSQEMKFARIVLATGGCSSPKIPDELCPEEAKRAGYTGLVYHTSQFSAKLDETLALVKPRQTGVGNRDVAEDDDDRVIVIGGGKSAQDVCAKLANEGRKVTIVFDKTDTFLASTSPPPDFLRKSRLFSVLLPHRTLNTRLERFLHTTWIGSKIVHGMLGFLQEMGFKAYKIPADSPFRKSHSMFWGVRLSDDGTVRPDSFYGLVGAGLIDYAAPHRVRGYSQDGRGVILDNNTTITGKVVVLATGYKSSWSGIFSDETKSEIGFGKHVPALPVKDYWNYTSMVNGPKPHPDSYNWTTTILRGIVPAKNILHRDFAIAGSLFTANPGYTSEVAAHWISSYFLGDKMKIPQTTEAALVEAEKESIWMKIRFPDMLSWVNESYGTSLDFWTWPQAADELLDDMYLTSQRSGGNWFTWPFKVIQTRELESISRERRALNSR